MKREVLVLIPLILLGFFACQHGHEQRATDIDGLWVVKKVVMGDEEMTPNARWTRFNADQTQESGNGWLQHSFGTWELTESKELSIINLNGVKDEDGPFKIALDRDRMLWTRNEGGEEVLISLERSEELPANYADRLIGLWQFEEFQGHDQYFQKHTSAEHATLFLRWDRRFVLSSELGRINGVYNVHAHKAELELIPYGEVVQRDFWSLDFDEEYLTLTLLNSDSLVTRKLIRIHEFPS